MLEVQAAIGRIQLKRLADWTSRRTAIAHRIATALAPFDKAVRVPMPGEGLRHAFYRLYAYVRPEGLAQGWSRDRLVAALSAEGVQVLHGTCSEVYLEKAFEGTSFRPKSRLPIARALGETSLMFLTHPTMDDLELDRAVAIINRVMAIATA